MTETYSLQGRVAIVTGASQGLGLEIAHHFIKAGANLMLCARDPTMLEKAQISLLTFARPGQQVKVHATDVSVPTETVDLITATIEQLGKIDVLVNNAGVYGPKGSIEDIDWIEWLRAIEINLMGSVLMCRAVIPHFKSKGYGKIVQLSGGGATSPMPRLSAYAVSKAAIIRFVETLALELKDAKIDINAIAPGSLNTRMLQEVIDAGSEKVGQEFYERALRQQSNGGTSLSHGAELAVFLASEKSDGISGKLLSALWDPWRDFPSFVKELKASDVYTLRRIVPSDRNVPWKDIE
jgi:NAD(P)-dependent dehydrogenase (short-subunit alcohol dehydrogenase family)